MRVNSLIFLILYAFVFNELWEFFVSMVRNYSSSLNNLKLYQAHLCMLLLNNCNFMLCKLAYLFFDYSNFLKISLRF